MEIEKSNVAIIIDLDEYGKICDFNIDFQKNIEVCDKNDPNKIKLGLELGPKTVTKNISCGNCNNIINFNMIVRTARCRRKNKNKRKLHSDTIEAELEKLRKMQQNESEMYEEMTEETIEPKIDEHFENKEMPEIVQEEIIIGDTRDTSFIYQCPLEECNQLFKSTQSWQKHLSSQHQRGKSEMNPIIFTIAGTVENDEFQEYTHPDGIEVVLDNKGSYVFPKCSSCRVPISPKHSNDLCFFCQYQKSQKPIESFEIICNLCSNIFDTQEQLDEHTKKSHPVFRCPVCFVYFRTKNALADHMRASCKIKGIDCDLCSHIAISEHELKKHKEGHNVT